MLPYGPEADYGVCGHFFDLSSEGMLVADPDGNILDANASARRILRSGNPANSRLEDLFDFADARTERSWEEFRKTGSFDGRLSVSRGDDSFFMAKVSLRRDDDGNVAALLGARDVSERVRVEEALTESEDRFRALVENASDFVVLADENNVFMYASPAIERVMGYAPEELLGTVVAELMHPEHLPAALAKVAEVSPIPGQHNLGAWKYRHKDGSYVWLEVVVNNKMDDPSLRGVVCNCRDVSERVEAEERLRESEEFHRAVNENALDFVVVQREDNTLAYASPSVERLLGWTPEEVVGRMGADFIHPDDLEWAWPLFYEQLQNPEAGVTEAVNIRYKHKDGRWRWFESACNNQLGNPIIGGLVFNCRDVTERIEAEEKLKDSEERYRMLVEQVPAVNYTLVPAPEDEPGTMTNGSLSYISPQIEDLLGHPPERFFEEAGFWNSLIHPDDLDAVLAEDVRTDETGAPFEMEYRMRHEGGHYLWVKDAAALVADEGYPLLWQCVLSDITRRREAEEEVRRLNQDLEVRVEERTSQLKSALEEAEDNEELMRLSESRFRALVQRSSDVTSILDAEGSILYVSPAVEEILGHRAGELAEEKVFELIHPEDRETLARTFEELKKREGDTRSADFRFRHEDGSWRHLDAVFSNLSDEPGVGGIVVNSRDITERKKNEMDLRRSLDMLLALHEAGRVLISTLELEEVGPRLLKIMQRVSSLAAAVVHVRDENRKWHVWHTIGSDEVWRSARRTPEAIAARWMALQTGEHQTFELAENETPSGICLPLRIRDRAVGVLEAYGPEELVAAETTKMLRSLAAQAASALENARLYRELSQREQRLQGLVAKILVAQEEERKRVAYEVHDGLAQVASATHQYLRAYARRYPAASDEGARELEYILKLVRQTVRDARQIIANLRPTALDDLGLATALSQKVSEMRDEGWWIEYDEALGEERLPKSFETAFYRVAQEALTNARKHAKSRRVRVSLRRSAENRVRLEIKDWGQGFDPRTPMCEGGPGERVGLSGMRERIGMLGGDFGVRSGPGEGTTVSAEAPLPTQDEEVANGK